jgi:hypothetical protein
VSSHAKAASAGSTEGNGNSRGLFRRAFATHGASGDARGSGALALLALAFLSIGLLTALIGAVPAQALDRYQSEGFVPVAGAPTRAVVDDATGNLLFTNSATNEVMVFGPGGASATQLTSFGSGELSSPFGIAIDQTNGEVYVSDPGNNRIVRYTGDGQPTPTYTLDATYTSPAQGSNAAAGQIQNFAAPLAIDPANGDLLVLDLGNKAVSRFTAAGAFVNSFNGAGSQGGVFLNPLDVAVGGGVTYVVDSTDPAPDPIKGVPLGTSRVERFDHDGLSLGALPNNATGGPFNQGINKAKTVTYGRDTQSVFVATQGPGLPRSNVKVYRGGQLVASADYTDPGTGVAGLAADDGNGAASHRIYGLVEQYFGSGPTGFEVFKRLQVPDVSLDTATNVTPSTAHLSGTVDAINSSASYHFEYSRVGKSEGKIIPEPDGEVAAGESPKAVEADLAGLSPNIAYEFRLVASNDDGGNSTSVRTFTTVASPPEAFTRDAIERSIASATLRGTINPLNSQTTYHFEYGTTSAYGSRSPLEYEAPAGKGEAPLPVTQPLFGLEPVTTYHYRVVAVSAAGTSFGEDKSFTTLGGSDAPRRGYELVSPAEKKGNNVIEQLSMQSSEDGNAFTFLGRTILGGEADTDPYHPRYVSQRSATEWTTGNPVDPPQTPSVIVVNLTFGVSEDGTKAFALSLKKLAPGAVEGDTNIYLRDVQTGAFTTVGTSPGRALFDSQTSTFNNIFVQGTPNFDHVLFMTGPPLLPGAPEGALYDFTGGQLHIASIGPDGTPLGNAGGAVGTKSHDAHVISADGSRIVFTAEGRVFYRADGLTRELTKSRRSSDPGAPRPGSLANASRDFRYVFFTSKDLTDDSLAGIPTLYRYDAQTDELEALTRMVDIPTELASVEVMQVSADGSSVYFETPSVLTPDAMPGWPNIYVWREGALQLAASIDPSLNSSGNTGTATWWASPNGRYFVFRSAAQLTDYDPASSACQNLSGGENGVTCNEIYRYDADTGQIVCASCRPDGKAPTGPAGIGADRNDSGTYQFPRTVTDFGQVFFESPDQLVRVDVNSFPDVYEYDDQGLRLISTGEGTGAQLAEVSANGRDVFFTTKDRLVGIDIDNATDVYDARVNGGLASQNPPPSREECIRDDCKETPTKGPELPFGGSEGLSGPENVKESAKQRCGKGRHARKVKGKTRCVKQKKKQRANNHRRQGQ